MKEIKYRAWDNLENRMYENVQFGIYQDPDEIISFEDILSLARFEIMQYTGLQDKNGKEIFEGDVVKCTDGADEIHELNSDTGIGAVEWLDIWGFWNISNIENSLGDIKHNGYVEVIGNIIDNPELLEAPNGRNK